MKNALRLFAIMFLASLTAQTFAQPTYGVKGGLNFANMLIKDDFDTYSSDFKMNLGFNVGGTAEFLINEMFAFETGLFLACKGFKTVEKGDGWKETLKLNLLYLDIPLTGKAYFDLSGQKVYGIFGPYIGMGLSGKYKYKWDDAGDTGTETETIEWGSDGEIKRFDFGLTFGAGIEIKTIQIGLTYNLGLANVSSTTEGGAKINNRVLALTAGYRF